MVLYGHDGTVTFSLLGNIHYEIGSAPTLTGVCHCLNCQRQGGSAFSTLASVASNDFSFTQGAPKLYKDEDTDSGNPVERYFHAEDRKHNVPFRQIVKIRMALFQTFGWRAVSGWVVVQADAYRLTSCFLSR